MIGLMKNRAARQEEFRWTSGDRKEESGVASQTWRKQCEQYGEKG